MATNLTRVHFTYTLRDFYKDYRSLKASEGKTVKQTIPEKKYKGVIEGFLIHVMKKVIYENFSFIIPYGMGLQCVTGRKTNLKKARIDYNKSRTLKKEVKHLNTHTFGFYYFLNWIKTHTNFKNHTFYEFKVVRSKNATEAGVGRKVLSHHIQATSKDHLMNSYTRI